MKNYYLAILFFFIFQIETPAQKQELTFATYTYSTNTRLQNLESLTNYLSQKTGFIIRAKSYASVKDLIEAIKNDSVDFAMINTLGYLVLQKNKPNCAIPMQTLEMEWQGSTNYGGCLITRRDNNINSAGDLSNLKKGTSLSLVNPSSTSGNLVPRLLLNGIGIRNAADNFSVNYAGTHNAVIDDVLAGKAILGGCGCPEVDSARKYSAFNEQAIVIDSFKNIPVGPILHHKKVDKKVVEKISHYLSVIHIKDPAAFHSFISGWTEFRPAIKFTKINDHYYSAFRKMFGQNELLWKMIE